jgi:hypothetical protein
LLLFSVEVKNYYAFHSVWRRVEALFTLYDTKGHEIRVSLLQLLLLITIPGKNPPRVRRNEGKERGRKRW